MQSRGLASKDQTLALLQHHENFKVLDRLKEGESTFTGKLRMTAGFGNVTIAQTNEMDVFSSGDPAIEANQSRDLSRE